jgi:hypothetical protein
VHVCVWVGVRVCVYVFGRGENRSVGVRVHGELWIVNRGGERRKSQSDGDGRGAWAVGTPHGSMWSVLAAGTAGGGLTNPRRGAPPAAGPGSHDGCPKRVGGQGRDRVCLGIHTLHLIFFPLLEELEPAGTTIRTGLYGLTSPGSRSHIRLLPSPTMPLQRTSLANPIGFSGVLLGTDSCGFGAFIC